MNEREREEIKLALEMTESPGWKILKRDTEERAEALKLALITSAKTESELWYCRGVYDTMIGIIRYADTLEASLAAAEAAEVSED